MVYQRWWMSYASRNRLQKIDSSQLGRSASKNERRQSLKRARSRTRYCFLPARYSSGFFHQQTCPPGYSFMWSRCNSWLTGDTEITPSRTPIITHNERITIYSITFPRVYTGDSGSKKEKLSIPAICPRHTSRTRPQARLWSNMQLFCGS